MSQKTIYYKLWIIIFPNIYCPVTENLEETEQMQLKVTKNCKYKKRGVMTQNRVTDMLLKGHGYMGGKLR